MFCIRSYLAAAAFVLMAVLLMPKAAAADPMTKEECEVLDERIEQQCYELLGLTPHLARYRAMLDEAKARFGVDLDHMVVVTANDDVDLLLPLAQGYRVARMPEIPGLPAYVVEVSIAFLGSQSDALLRHVTMRQACGMAEGIYGPKDDGDLFQDLIELFLGEQCVLRRIGEEPYRRKIAELLKLDPESAWLKRAIRNLNASPENVR